MKKIVLMLFGLVIFLYGQNPSEKNMFNPDSDYIYYGKYKSSFYYAVQEKNFPDSPLSAKMLDMKDNTIVLVHPDFKRKADLEGTARLFDGRILNYVSHKKDGIRYQVIEGANYGLGVENYKLIPYRTIAVDPYHILIGSVVFIPQAVGIPLSNCIYHDGYFLAHDIGKVIKGKRIDFFVGFDKDTNNSFSMSGKILNAQEVDLYIVHGIMERTINLKYCLQYRWKLNKQLYEMTASELDTIMAYVNRTKKTIREKITFYSKRSKGTPYLLFCLGEGHNAPYDADPQIDFGRVDCMTFCEQILALSISRDYRQMFKNLQKIRYKDGQINILSRNHYTVADWLPNNNWLLYNVSEEIGGKYCAEMTKTIDRKAFFLGQLLPKIALKDIMSPQTLTVKYIPIENLLKIKNLLKGGEIISILSKAEGIFSSHMGIIVKDSWGNLIFRHASSFEKNRQVMDIKYDELVDNLGHSNSEEGILFIRVKEKI